MRDFEDIRKEALAEFLGVDVEDIEASRYNDRMLSCEGNEYLVCTEEEADEEFYDSTKSLIDEMGLEGFTSSFRRYILDNYVKTDFFEEVLSEEAYYLAESMDFEELAEECFNKNLVDEDYFEFDEFNNIIFDTCSRSKEELIDLWAEDYADEIDDAAQWVIDEFGAEEFEKLVEENDLIDWDGVIDEIQKWDGRGNSLASWDGVENEIKYNGTWFFIYKN